MSLLNRIDYPVLTPQSALLEALNRPTTFGEYLGAKVSQGFEGSIAGRLYEGLTEPAPNLPEVEVMGQTVPNPAYRPEAAMTREQYQASPYFREGVDWQEGMTEPLAAARADAYDSRRYRDQLIARYKGGLLGQVAGFGAAVLGGLPSPENFVPFVGPAERAAMVARLGWLGGHAAAGIADATLGTALADPIVMGDLNRRGEDFGAMDFAADLALGAVAGGLLGTASGFLTRGERLAETARAVRLDGLQRQADALEGALQSVTREEPVDVGPIATPEPAVVERLATPADTVDVRGTPIPGTAAREVATDAGPVIRAYHGSPHRFEEFSLEHVGAGEGAQAFGHGLYFAENPDIAEGYRKRLAPGKGIAVEDSAARYLQAYGGDRNAAIAYVDQLLASAERRAAEAPETLPDPIEVVRERFNAAKEAIRSGAAEGNLYAVDLKVSPDELLDWDKPLAEQSPNVRAAIRALLPNDPDLLRHEGQVAFNALAVKLAGGNNASPEVSKALREAGIPGIRYLDAGSRAKGEGSRNIVLFDDRLARIREVNGKAVERAEPERPSVSEAARRVKEPSTAAPAEAEKRLAADMGLAPAKGQAEAATGAAAVPAATDPDIAALRRAGKLTEADEAALAEADELVKTANGWATAYESLAGCVLRFGE